MSLCLSCQSFDIQAFSRRQNPWITTELAVSEAGDRQGCSFCKIIVEWHRKMVSAGFLSLGIFPRRPRWVHWTSGRLVNETVDGGHASRNANGLGIAMLLLRLSADPKPSLHFGLATIPIVFNLHADDESPAATSGDIIGVPPVDPDPSSASECQRIRRWLSSCESHRDCTTTLSMTKKVHKDCSPLPTRCLRVSVADASSSRLPICLALEETRGKTGQYICLSHRWSQPETERSKTTQSNYQDRLAGSAFGNLDPLFKDVFLLAVKIGIEYVWIDSLCITQDSPDDWKAEASQMSHYYQNAALTIMAAIPPEKRAQGLFHLPEKHLYKLSRLPYRDEEGTRKGYFYLSSQLDPLYEESRCIEENELLSRGWVFQEWALSRRMAWYTEEGLTLQCKCQGAKRWSESSIDLDPSARLKSLLPILGQPRVIEFSQLAGFGPQALKGPLCWQTTIVKYSTLKLSMPWKDRLIAVGGIAREYEAQEGKGSLVCGLRPWRLDLDLLWEQKGPGLHSRFNEFPSWSWASIDIPITWARGGNPTVLFQLVETASTHDNNCQIPETETGTTSTENDNPSVEGLLALPQRKRAMTGQVVAVPHAPEANLNALHIRGRLLQIVFGPVLDRPSEIQVLLASHYSSQVGDSSARQIQRRMVALATEQGTVAGWGSLEEPDLQDDQAFVPNPIIFALCISVSYVYREKLYLKALWGQEEIFDVLFIRPSGTHANGFVRVGMGRLFGKKALDEFHSSCDRNILLL